MCMAAVQEVDRLPQVGEVVRSESSREYKLMLLLGEGGYGSVFCTSFGDTAVALKAEKYSNSVLFNEIRVLKAATRARCEHICKLYDYGCVKPLFFFVVMTLLGKDLYRLRNEQSERRFSLSTAVRVGIHACKAIEELHSCGFISRDIKPSNYAVGLSQNQQQKTIFLFDFGLARRFVDYAGRHLPSRGEVGWRGTNRYGSLRAHLKQDLSRRDDLESWLYMLVEITQGALPWRFVREREEAEKAKIHARSKGRVEFLLKCPQQYDEILKTIDALSFEALPNYDQIYALLDKVCEQNQVMMNDRYDWEEETEISNGMLPSIGGIADTVLQKVDVSIRHKIDAHNKRNEKPVVRSKEALNV
uniref:Serine/threonine-protein kinase n=1 Tax=Ascaris suum TaxID=6253 RepID=F1KUN4_ASCSU